MIYSSRIPRHLNSAARVNDGRQRAENEIVARPSHWRCQPNYCLEMKRARAARRHSSFRTTGSSHSHSLQVRSPPPAYPPSAAALLERQVLSRPFPEPESESAS